MGHLSVQRIRGYARWVRRETTSTRNISQKDGEIEAPSLIMVYLSLSPSAL